MDCESFSNEEKVALVGLVTNAEAEVTGSKAMLAQNSSTLLLKYLMTRVGRSALN